MQKQQTTESKNKILLYEGMPNLTVTKMSPILFTGSIFRNFINIFIDFVPSCHVLQVRTDRMCFIFIYGCWKGVKLFPQTWPHSFSWCWCVQWIWWHKGNRRSWGVVVFFSSIEIFSASRRKDESALWRLRCECSVWTPSIAAGREMSHLRNSAATF